MYKNSKSDVSISYTYAHGKYSATYDLFFGEYESDENDVNSFPKEKNLEIHATGYGNTREEAEQDVIKKLSVVTFGKDLVDITQEDVDSLEKFEGLDVKLLVSGY